MATTDNGPTPPGAPPGSPSPGVLICQGCPNFADCEKQVAQGYLPSCSGPTAQAPNSAPSGAYTGSAGQPSSVSYTGASPVSFIPSGFDWTTLAQQAGLIVVALVIVVAGFYLAFSKQVNSIVGKVAEVAV